MDLDLWVGWLVCFGLNSLLRQYFSLYWAVSQREGERKEMIEERKNSKQPHPHQLQAQWTLALPLSKFVGCSISGSLPSTITSPDHPRRSLGLFGIGKTCIRNFIELNLLLFIVILRRIKTPVLYLNKCGICLISLFQCLLHCILL